MLSAEQRLAGGREKLLELCALQESVGHGFCLGCVQ